MAQSVKALLSVIALLICGSAKASDIVVIGKLLANEPMSYAKEPCADNEICLHSWWKAVIKVERSLDGPPLPARVTAEVSQHTSMNDQYKKAARHFVLEAIEDASMRKKRRTQYYLKESSIEPPSGK